MRRSYGDDPGDHLTGLFNDHAGCTAIERYQGNAYFSAVVPVVERHGGMLNQYIGDGMMVIFGSPVAQDDHAARAVRAAAEMVRLVDELREQWAQLDCPGFRIGVGIHTGRAVLGMVGSPNRLDYTALGAAMLFLLPAVACRFKMTRA